MSPFRKELSFLVTVALCVVNLSCANERLRSEDFRTHAVFDLVVNKSDVLRPGASRIEAESAFVTLAHGLVPGNSDGLEIVFLTKPITEMDRADILNNDARELKKDRYAALVLFLDKEYKVSQANLSYVVPGTTVGRTIAWKPDELEKYFSKCSFDGKRLILKSEGSYSEMGPGQETVSLSWNVDLNLPVIREVKR